jgi:3-hydroxyisobutyrate dehydrogenase-like beta-hydroxyacid dehydrogenase
LTVGTVGFVGLGSMGNVLASNLVACGHDVLASDVAGPTRAPDGVTFAGSVAEVARGSDVIVLSLPDGAASEQVVRAVVDTADRRVAHVVDTSTIGPPTARRLAEVCAAGGVAYIDAPVSGGVAGARARTLLVMYAGTDDACARVEPVLEGLSDRRRRVGTSPGLAQAMKLANNFLSATCLVATSEAVAFGVAEGLDMATMLDVLNQASGGSVASRDKFPDHVLTGRYAAGFANTLMDKDVRLYVDAVKACGGATAIGDVTASVWQEFAEAEPGADFTRIYPFLCSEEGR